MEQQGFVARLRTAFQYVSTGRADWFGPGDPMPSVAPPDVAGRALDFPTGYNRNLAPRALEPVSFSQLRVLADAYDLMRLVIETRKDQVSRMVWNVKPRDAKAQPDARCDRIREFLRQPDREHDWDVWVRALIEDMLVIDAATIYPRRTRGGDLFSLDLIDGATIKRVIGSDGRTPIEGPAYQQILKGVVAGEFTREEIIYRVRNWRAHRVYGFSPVEQVISTVNIALRRQIHQLQYYTEGNVPEALVGVPENWTVDQIKQFQGYWDEILEGNTAKRRHAKFVPGGLSYQPTKDSVLKDAYDEWLARIVCFAFGISAQPFVKEMNRATAETAENMAKEEGLAPVLAWVKSTIDIVISRYFGAPDLEFDWVEEDSIEPEIRAKIHKVYVDAGVLTPDEVREELGRDPLTPEERERMAAQRPPAPPGSSREPEAEEVEGDEEGEEKEAGAYLGDLAKRRAGRPKPSSPAPINRERRAAKRAEAAIRSATETAFAEVLDEAIAATSEVGKAANDADRIAAALRLAGFEKLAETLAGIFEDLVRDAGREALVQIDVEDRRIVELVNVKAVEWARTHAAELVGMRWVDGELRPNPNAAYRIDEVTRSSVRSLVTQAIDGGWSNDRLADELRGAYAFSKERADLIAVTETAFADVAGNMIAYEESGVVKEKRWIIGSQEKLCEVCSENHQQGPIPFSKSFASGHMAPPGHPRCRCDLLPITDSETGRRLRRLPAG
jgi:SPP1 gp7 family putative phage head morphogenesis protein